MELKLNNIKKKEILYFIIGGGSAVLVDFITYYLLIFIGLSYSPSKAISYVLGASVGFIINKYWTFESHKFSSVEILYYIFLYACTACANTLVNKIVLFVTSREVFAFICATGVSTILNFLGQKFFVFRK